MSLQAAIEQHSLALRASIFLVSVSSYWIPWFQLQERAS